jgi:general secretion pathway protein B
MSFILDALRKSEHARQRQTGPGLAEVAVAPPQSRTNVWGTAAVVLLLVNLLAVGVLLLRRAQRDEAPAATVSSSVAPPATSAPAAQPPVTSTTPPAPAATYSPPPGSDPAAAAATTVPPPAPSARNPLAEEVSQGAGIASLDPTLAEGAASVPAGPPAVVAARPKRGSVVYAPIPEASDAPYTNVAPATDGLPSADEIAGQGGLPALHLDLHVYADAPAQRFIFVNSRKYREGETLQEGPLLERITRDGAVLSFRGSRFRLASD